MSPQEFIAKWGPTGGSESANYIPFLEELCDLLEVPRPDPSFPEDERNTYVFQKRVKIPNGDGTESDGILDLYRRNRFVCETKQGVAQAEADAFTLGAAPIKRKKGHGVRQTPGMDRVMRAARNQAERYAKALPDEWPPFLVVVDVGATIELYADFSGTGKNYAPYPAAGAHRITLEELEQDSVRETLKAVWLDPLALDPTRRTTLVTREIARDLAELARKLEQNHPPKAVSEFLLRCVFTMFAEDIGLLRENSFRDWLEGRRKHLDTLPDQLEALWQTMNTGGFSPALDQRLLRFNGGLFADGKALPLDEPALDLMIRAAKAKWNLVEPAIFGTLFENALGERERHHLGAHYTPRRYVERLVLPTIVEPLRADWTDVQTAAATLDEEGKPGAALDLLRKFHHELCHVRVLDPACGTGNFLYVTYEHLKRLELEVLDALAQRGEMQTALGVEGATVTPAQLFGIEKEAKAAAIAELVLWIGHIQWHFRTHGVERPPEPVLRDYGNILCRDAVLAFDARVPVRDAQGQPVRTYDGITVRINPTTGREEPDPTATVPVYEYTNARRAEWPEAEFIVGNPPYIGNWKMRRDLDGGYAETLRRVYPDVPESSDYVMYWWDRAADLVRTGGCRRFGLVTTNSLRQVFARRVMERHLTAEPPLSLAFAIPDHPWIKDLNSADVRVALSVGQPGRGPGVLKETVAEHPGDVDGMVVELSERMGPINADLTVGVDVTVARRLRANRSLASPGVKLHGDGFIVTPAQAEALGLGRIPGLENHIRAYRNGRDINQRPRGVMVIDLFGLKEIEVRDRFPEVYQWVYERVKQERDLNNRPIYRDVWWVFGEPRRLLRPVLAGLPRYIATTETSKHRFFTFLDGNVLPDNKLVAIGSSDGAVLGVLSSKFHLAWAHGNRALLEDRPVYVKSTCFDPFPFPDATEDQRQRIRNLAERLDGHRKARQALYPELRLTDVYNVLAKIREEAPLTDAERRIHEQALVTVLRTLHDELDAAVADAYGWPSDLEEAEVLRRLVALNRERHREERDGRVRWLRPEAQAPEEARQDALVRVAVDETAEETVAAVREPWPKTPAERARAVRLALERQAAPATVEEIAGTFRGAPRKALETLLEVMVGLGQARKTSAGLYAP
ncbi:MAG: DNA methyltransferase [Fimbriimonas sp.]